MITGYEGKIAFLINFNMRRKLPVRIVVFHKVIYILIGHWFRNEIYISDNFFHFFFSELSVFLFPNIMILRFLYACLLLWGIQANIYIISNHAIVLAIKTAQCNKQKECRNWIQVYNLQSLGTVWGLAIPNHDNQWLDKGKHFIEIQRGQKRAQASLFCTYNRC